MLGNKPPYTTMQQLNLDWVLSKLKTLLRLVPDDGAVGQILRRTRDGAVWSDEQGGGGGAVNSVNGKTGTVVLDAADVGALPDDYTPPVTSVNGQTGAVVIETPSDIFNKELSSRCFGKGLSSSTIDFILYLPYIDVPYNIAFTNNEVNVADIGPSTVSIIHAKDTMCVYFRVSASGVTTNSMYVAGATFTLTKV